MIHPAPPQRPHGLWPLGPWLAWARGGLFVRGHVVNQAFLFCLVGASGVIVNSAAMWLFYAKAGLPYLLASVGAFMAASVNNFTLNKLYTFQDPLRGLKAVTRQYLRFLSVTFVGLGVNLAVLAALVELWGVHPLPANLAGVLLATISNFLGNKFFAFRR